MVKKALVKIGKYQAIISWKYLFNVAVWYENLNREYSLCALIFEKNASWCELLLVLIFMPHFCIILTFIFIFSVFILKVFVCMKFWLFFTVSNKVPLFFLENIVKIA